MKYFRLNQTVYHSDYGQGKVVALEDPEDLEDVYSIEVEFVSHTVCFTEDGRKYDEYPISLSQNPIPEIVNKPIEDTYVPFTFEDNLLGKTVICKTAEMKGIITHQDIEKVLIGDYTESYKVLFQDYTFADGKVCGKLG
jgi:hypothetical protein